MNRIGDNLLHFGPNEDIVRHMVSASVEFEVIGGLAIAWHCANRQADDMDLLVNPTPESLMGLFLQSYSGFRCRLLRAVNVAPTIPSAADRRWPDPRIGASATARG